MAGLSMKARFPDANQSNWIVGLCYIHCLCKTPFFFFDLFSAQFGIGGLLRPILGFAVLLVAWVIRPPKLRVPLIVTVGGLALITAMTKLYWRENYSGVELFFPAYVDILVYQLIILSLNFDEIVKLFRLYRNTIILLSLPALVAFMAILVNAPAPYEQVALGGRDSLYRLYGYIAVFSDSTITALGPLSLARVCGPFEEPGLLGTLIGFLLIADFILHRRMNGWRWCLVALGILSQSLAFYVLALLLLVYHLLNKRMLRSLLAVCAGFITLFATYLILPEEGQRIVDSNIIGRMSFDIETKEFRDTSRAGYHERFVSYLADAEVDSLLIGNGYGSNRRNSIHGQYSTIHAIAFEMGLIGFLLLSIFTYYYYIWIPIKYGAVTLLVLSAACIASFFQRPDMLSVQSWFVIIMIMHYSYGRLKINPRPGTNFVQQTRRTVIKERVSL